MFIVREDQLSSTPFYNFFSTNLNATSLSFLRQITVEMNDEHTVDHLTVGDIPILSQRETGSELPMCDLLNFVVDAVIDRQRFTRNFE